MIHIETDVVREKGNAITYTVEDMWNAARILRGLAEDLDIQWEGGAASQETAERLRSLVAGMKQNLALLDGQAQALIRQANAWEEADQYWAAQYSDHAF